MPLLDSEISSAVRIAVPDGESAFAAWWASMISIEEKNLAAWAANNWPSIDPIEKLGIRTVMIRTGLVLGKGDGFLSKLAPLFKYRLGAIIGSGKQYMPWIHIKDLCHIYLKAIEEMITAKTD